MSNLRKPSPTGTKGDDDVGYGQPPKQTRFKPGRSGNPGGRPKGARNFKTDVRVTLETPVKVTRDGMPRKVSTQKAMLLRLREKALSGDPRALDRLIHLAQAFNNEETAAAGSLSAHDADILQIFKARVLSGAAGAYDSSEGSEESVEGSPLNRSIGSGERLEATASTRVRLKMRARSEDERRAVDEHRSNENEVEDKNN